MSSFELVVIKSAKRKRVILILKDELKIINRVDKGELAQILGVEFEKNTFSESMKAADVLLSYLEQDDTDFQQILNLRQIRSEIGWKHYNQKKTL